ncbi:MAG: radical SAM family heme chaperone HemW [Deltaproteobacteria bacterium]|nr:radical SAM family heme chaperone HemW [Deltaproteobacteria bacterium]
MKNAGVYIHLPYCARRCVYCDFTVSVLKQEEELSWYLKALHREILFYAQSYPDKIVDTIFFGGGTPSLFSARQISGLVTAFCKHFKTTPSLEISLEANPCSVTLAKLKGLKEGGVNRVSFGMQTFHPKLLEILQRSHSQGQALMAYHLAREAGFQNINLDFIFGIPRQSLPELQEDIQRAVSLGPEHISTYHLSVPQNNPLHPLLPLEEVSADMYEWVMDFLPSCGYTHYEVSAFSKPSFQCAHNLKYWKLHDYLGFGVGASSYITTPQMPWGHHFKNTDSLQVYWKKTHEEGHAKGQEEVLTKEQAQKEYLLTHLRLIEGVSLEEYEERFGSSLMKSYGSIVDKLLTWDLLDSVKKMLKLTPRGILYLNKVLVEFM